MNICAGVLINQIFISDLNKKEVAEQAISFLYILFSYQPAKITFLILAG